MTSFYNIMLFFHIIGTACFAAGIILSIAAHAKLKKAATPGEAWLLIKFFKPAEVLTGGGFVFSIITGLHMTATVWGWKQMWINMSMTGIILLLVFWIIMGVNRRKMYKELKKAPQSSLPLGFERRTHAYSIRLGLSMMISLLVGIMLIMTIKPAAALSGGILVASLAVGALLSLRR